MRWAAAPLLAAASAVTAPALTGPTVTIPGLGAVRGSTSGGVNIFRGIPYAAPPVGAAGRWHPPADPEPWSGTRAATSFGSTCVGAGHGTEAEDCLFLNVYAPATPGAQLLPTMVWIHGGGYTKGASNTYPAESLVAASDRSVIVVSINYRLNVFGFLGSMGLEGSGGGFGIRDQRKALEWVKAHIAAFGGDAGNVLIFGGSAGGDSVLNHLTQSASFGLYHRAVIQSGTYDGSVSEAAAELRYAAVKAALGCADAACSQCCMRSASTSAVRAAAGAAGGWGPMVDGAALAAAPRALLRAGEWNAGVPVVLGSNRDEYAFFSVGEEPKNMTEAQFLSSIPSGVDKAKVEALYAANGAYPYPADLGAYSHWHWASMRVRTDAALGLGACSVRGAARDMSSAKGAAVWVYLFAHPAQMKGIHGTGVGAVFAPHASEVDFVFGDGGTAAGEAALSREMAGYWARFASAGDPNGDGAVHWPRYTAAGDAILRFETASGTLPGAAGTRAQTGLRKGACDFWVPPPPRWACGGAGTCVQAHAGHLSQANCEAACSAPGPGARYDCGGFGACYQVKTGGWPSLGDCGAVCRAPAPTPPPPPTAPRWACGSAGACVEARVGHISQTKCEATCSVPGPDTRYDCGGFGACYQVKTGGWPSLGDCGAVCRRAPAPPPPPHPPPAQTPHPAPRRTMTAALSPTEAYPPQL